MVLDIFKSAGREYASQVSAVYLFLLLSGAASEDFRGAL
jgi:hypothetical protein